MSPRPDPPVGAVVFDLFGTLVPAPTPRERAHAASQLAAVMNCRATAVEDYFLHSWQERHDGTVPTVAALAAHLVHAVGEPNTALEPVVATLVALAARRLVPDSSVLRTLGSLRDMGIRLGVLSDASAEIAACWPESLLATAVDAAVFSCEAGSTKPDRRLYEQISGRLGVPAHRTLFVGDGGGDELRGALAVGMTAIAVRRRGPTDALAFGYTAWSGPILDRVERLPAHLAEGQ